MKKILFFLLIISLSFCDIPFDYSTRYSIEAKVVSIDNNNLKNVPFRFIAKSNLLNSYTISNGYSDANGTISTIFPKPDLETFTIDALIEPTDKLPVTLLNVKQLNFLNYVFKYPKITLYSLDELVELSIIIVSSSTDKELKNIEIIGKHYQEFIYINTESEINQYQDVYLLEKNQNAQIKYSVFNYGTNTLEEYTKNIVITDVNSTESITY